MSGGSGFQYGAGTPDDLDNAFISVECANGDICCITKAGLMIDHNLELITGEEC